MIPGSEPGTTLAPEAVRDGVVVDLAGVPVRLHAADAARCDAVCSLFRHALISARPAVVTLAFGREPVPVPDAEPAVSVDDADLWWTGADTLVIRTEAGLTARSTAEAVVVGGDAPGLAREFRFVALIALAHLLARHDRHLVHGAAVVIGPGALLVVGDTGTGKSTLAFAAHRLGWPVLADDAVLLRRDGGHVYVQGVPRPVAVGADVTSDPVVGGRVVPDDARARTELPAGTLASGEYPVAVVAVTAGRDPAGPTIAALRGASALRMILRASFVLADADVRPALFALGGDLARLPVWSLCHGDDPTTALADATAQLESLQGRLGLPS
jgi:hypothetical protein